nr:hypothetical protein CPGR_00270 [Mycolicibacterium malmesburyense]
MHAVHLGEGGLHLAEFDAVPADLDLLVGATQILKLPISGPANQIPGPVHPLPVAREWA